LTLVFQFDGFISVHMQSAQKYVLYSLDTSVPSR